MKAHVIGMAVAMAAAMTAAAPALAHQGHSHQAAWTACDGKDLGAECAWLDHAQARYSGTCRAVAERRICIRNRPIEPAANAWARVWRVLGAIAPGA